MVFPAGSMRRNRKLSDVTSMSAGRTNATARWSTSRWVAGVRRPGDGELQLLHGAVGVGGLQVFGSDEDAITPATQIHHRAGAPPGAQHTVCVLIGGNSKLSYEVCSARLDVEDSRLFSQLSELKVSSVVPVGRQEVEPVTIRPAARVVSVSQVQPVHVRLGKGQRRRQRDSLQQQLAVARRLRDDVAQVGGGRVGVGEPQLVGGEGFRGAVLQPEARVVVEGRRDAVAVLHGEVEGAAAGRGAVGVGLRSVAVVVGVAHAVGGHVQLCEGGQGDARLLDGVDEAVPRRDRQRVHQLLRTTGRV
ncbi:hypothetical protein EYF80_024004 [Liparis tanakae]|uniref:Uncharacterized protein n=1 Tax=Liparis tanakae TaxID=230148 RepID=A0A4Z2HJD5_9TELE|nr:hypothetical protein EYF80_024004 [Liparis tanakae]